MSQIAYPTHPNPAVQEEINRKVTADVFAALAEDKSGQNPGSGTLALRALGESLFARECAGRVGVALAVANAQVSLPAVVEIDKESLPKWQPSINLDDDLDNVELGPACSLVSEACESCQ